MTLYSRRPFSPKRIRVGAVAFLALTVLGACAQSGSSGSPGSTGGQQTTFEQVKQRGIAEVGFANEPPFTIAAPEGLLTGIDPDIFRAVMKGYGVKTLDGVLVEFPGLIPGLLASRFDVIAAGLAINPTRCKQIAFANPGFVTGDAIVVKSGNPLKLHSYNDVKNNPNVRIGVLRGGQQADYLTKFYDIPEGRLSTFPSGELALAAMQAGRIDVYANSSVLIGGELKALNDPSLERATPFTQPVDKQGHDLHVYLAAGFRMQDSDFVDAYNAGLAKLRASGELLTILKNYGLTEEELPPADITAQKLCQG
jgi:polar amino acid transport system substrate-binding protein